MTFRPHTPEDLVAYLARHDIPGEVLRFAQPTPTVEAAAQAAGVPPERIVKTVVFAVRGEEPLLVITNGTRRVSARQVARLLGVGRKQVRLAKPEQVLAWTGYPVGGVPPLGHPRRLPTWLDRRVLAYPEVLAGGGDDHTLLRIAPQVLLQATQAQVVDFEEVP